MKKVMRLVSIQIWAVLADMLSLGNNRRKKPKVLYLGVLLFVLAMSAISFFYCMMIGSGLKMFQSIEILPAFMMAITCILVLMTTVFKVKGTIFGFRDYDMVMSLPVSTSGIVTSRLFILYALNMVFVLIMMAPMMVAYGILTTPSLSFYLISTVLIPFLPLVPIVIASFLGTIIAYAASRFRHHNLLNIIFSMGLLIMIIVLSFAVEDSGQGLVDVSRALTGQVNRVYPLAGLYSDAVINYDIAALLLFIGVSAAAFILYTALIQKLFKKINTLIMTGRYHSKYILGELKISSPLKALYRKELKRYFSSSLYVLNTAFGIVMLTLGTIAAIFVDMEVVIKDDIARDYMIKSGPVFLSFCIIMSCTTMASISLEGRSLWILKSLPVTPGTIYKSKIAVNLTIISPALIDAVILGVVLKTGVLPILYMELSAMVCAVFISEYGLLINLLFPNFSWTSETVVIKQSVAALVSIFSGIGVVGIQFLFLLFMPSQAAANLGYIGLVAILDVILYRILMTYGKRRFAAL